MNAFTVLCAGNYVEPIDSRIHISAAISKNEKSITKRNINSTLEAIIGFILFESYPILSQLLILIDL